MAFMGGLRETTKYLIQDNHTLAQKSNPGPYECSMFSKSTCNWNIVASKSATKRNSICR
jgi:hypothetical protein